MSTNPERKRIKLPVLSEEEAEGMSWVAPTENFPEGRAVFIGSSDMAPEMICGNCERVLVKGLEMNQLIYMVVKCPDCGKLNKSIL